MNAAEFQKRQASGDLLCDRLSGECSTKIATQIWSQSLYSGALADARSTAAPEQEIFVYCDAHAPKNAKPLQTPPPPTGAVGDLPGKPGIINTLGNQQLALSSNYGARFKVSDYPDFENGDDPATFMLLQTTGASFANPLRVTFDQHILEVIDGQFDLVEREAVRRSFAGVSNGTTTLSDPSGEMNWQEGDEGELIKVGRGQGEIYEIQSVEDEETVILDRAIEDSLIGLTLEMEGKNEVTIATRDGFTDGALTGTANTAGAQSHFSKLITSDKIYTVVVTPGATGDGSYEANVIALSAKFRGVIPTPYQLGPSDADLQLIPATRDSTIGTTGASYNITPRDMLIGGLISMAALSMVGIGIYFAGGIAVAASPLPIVAGTTIAGTTTYTVGGVTLYGVAAEEAGIVSQGLAAGGRLSMAVANILTRSLMARAADIAAGGDTAGFMNALVALALAQQEVNHGNHGTYLGHFMHVPGGDATNPGFPGFPGNAPLQPGVRCYIVIVNGTPDGSPPICFFED